MNRLIFEYSPLYFIACLALGASYAFLMYSSRHSWSRFWNRFLFGLRMVLVSLLLLLLLGPILKQTENIYEKPTLAFLVDNSQSIKETTDTAKLISTLRQMQEELKNSNRDVEFGSLDGASDNIRFYKSSSDLANGLRETVNRFEGKNLAGIVLISDGIYNGGISPLYVPFRIPVHTIGVGDTTERADVVLKGVDYNRIVYQGNKFPLRAEVGMNGFPNQDITVTVLSQGKMLQQLKKNSGTRANLEFDFQLDAGSQGMQRLEVRVENLTRDSNLKNNRASAFVEVVEGKKKILLIAPAPHPDIKALREVIEKNPNYEFYVHIPGVVSTDFSLLQPGKADLLIALQSPDQDVKTTPILTSFIKAKASVFIMVGNKSQLRAFAANGVPVTFDATSQRDEVQPVLNIDYKDLGFSDGLNTNITRFPPVTVPFGKFSFPVTAKIILYQKIGSLATERPLLFTVEYDQQKMAVLTGDGIWKWRLNEFRETEKTLTFDELFLKLLQYLSTRDDRRKFRCFPLQHEFNSDGPVVMESQVYNDIFEPVFGNTINLELRDEQGKVSRYSYIIGPGNSRYRIGGLKEGVYKYKASTDLKGKTEEVRGEFLVTEQSLESQNLTADFDLLRKLSENTGGKFYQLAQADRFAAGLADKPATSLIHTEESFDPLINLKTVFFLLLALISTEWFLRKYFGSY